MDELELLIALLCAKVCEIECVEKEQSLSAETVEKLYELAQKHDLAHLAGEGLRKLGLLGEDEISAKFKQATRQAKYRYIRTDSEYQKLCQAFEAAQIPFLPLKGSVLRDYYPEPWMRTSCDIDILVPEEMLDTAANVLTEKLDYTRKGQNNHDLSMYAPNGLHVELHYRAVDEGRFPAAQTVLETIWDDALPKAAESCHYCMSDEMFYFYHIAHMAKHFENGGCGIRPFLDLWILNHRMAHDRQKRTALLSRGGILAFAEAAERLSEVWFSGAEASPLSRQLEQFVLDGGVYGSIDSHVVIQQVKSGGKGKYFLFKLFLPYNTIKYYYPILQKHKWLTPVYQVIRWVKILFKGITRRTIRELKLSAACSPEESTATAELLKQLGL